VGDPDEEAGRFDDPPVQAARVPSATTTPIPASRVRVNLFM
jgi:hypothetical protein